MKKIALILAILASGHVFAQGKKDRSREVDVYTTYVVGKVARIEIPATKQRIFLGTSFTNSNKGTWYICTDPLLAQAIDSITSHKDTAVLTGAELQPFHTFTAKQWRSMKRKARKKFPIESHMKLNDVQWVLLTSVAINKKPLEE